MRGIIRILLTGLKLLILALLGAQAAILRYLWNTPQPLRNTLPGEPRIYRWKDGQIFYKVVGPSEAPPLVLFHAPGIGASSYEMRHLIKKLAQQYRLYVPDLLGFGLSDRPHLDYRAETYVQWYQDFVATVIGQPTTFIGSGLSGNYSVAVAAHRPDLCQRVIVLAPTTLFTVQQWPAWLTPLFLNPYTGLLLYSLFTTRVILCRIVAWQHTNGSAINGAQISSEELASVFANAHQFGAEHAVLAWLAGKLDLNVLPKLEQVTQPVLICRETNPEQITATMLAWLKEQDVISSPATIETDLEADSRERVASNEHMEGEAAIEAAPLSAVVQEKPVTKQGDETGPILIQEKQAVEQGDETGEAARNVSVEVSESVPGTRTFEAYCVKCRHKRTMQNAKKVVTKKGRSAMEGTCPVCGTRLFRFTGG